MAYNNLSGTVIKPNALLPRTGPDGNIIVPIISGSLSTSDGADVINVPRVSNATNNAIITNVGGDANTLTCESNLTFDGTTLNIVGELTASVAISASYYVGDGSKLSGLAVGTAGGIFTQLAANQAFTTSSVSIGANTTPLARMHIVGSSFMSGAVVHKRKLVNANYSVATTDYYVGVDTTNNTVKLTLPEATQLLDGQTIIIKDEGGSANSNHITVSGSASDTIDGKNTILLESPFASIQLYCNGENKFFIC